MLTSMWTSFSTPHLSCSSNPPNTLGAILNSLGSPNSGGNLSSLRTVWSLHVDFLELFPYRQATHICWVPVTCPALRRLKTDKDECSDNMSQGLSDPQPAACLSTGAPLKHTHRLKYKMVSRCKDVLKVWVTSWGFQTQIRSEKWVGGGESELLHSFKPLKTSHWPLSFPTEGSSLLFGDTDVWGFGESCGPCVCMWVLQEVLGFLKSPRPYLPALLIA